MNRIRIAFVLFCALALLALIAPPAPAQTPLTPEALLELEDGIWRETMAALLQPERVPEYIALCNEARERQVRTKYDEPLLGYLYGVFDNYYSGIDAAGRGVVREFVMNRMKEFPDDRTWPVLYTNCLIKDAWAHRGSGWANTVTEEGWEGFRTNLQEAYKLLSDMLPQYPDDLEPCSQMVTVCMGLSRPSMEIYGHLRNGFRIDPKPLSLIRGATYAFLPRWLGDNDGSNLVRLAEWCAQQGAESSGDALYLVVATEAAESDGYDQVMNEYGFNPARIASAARDYASRVANKPSANHAAARLICSAGKRDTAASLFETLAYDPAASYVWSESTFNAWRAWALEDGPQPGATALHVAARSGNTTQIERALADGAAIDGVDDAGLSALQIAANEKHWDAVARLLEEGADPNVFSADEAPPIMRAAGEGNAAIVERLLAANASPKVSFRNSCALMEAVKADHVDVVDILLRADGINVNHRGAQNWTPLFHAIYEKRYDTAKRLLDAGADTSIVTSSGWTALSATMQEGDVEIVRALIDAGASPFSGGSNGWTAFHMAVFGDRRDISDYLLTLPGVSINATMGDGWAPIHQAAAEGKDYTVAYILSKPDVAVNQTTPEGHTALHVAARDGHEKTVRMLLEAGADPSLKNSDGKTPADLAAAKNFSKVVSLLQTR